MKKTCSNCMHNYASNKKDDICCVSKYAIDITDQNCWSWDGWERIFIGMLILAAVLTVIIGSKPELVLMALDFFNLSGF